MGLITKDATSGEQAAVADPDVPEGFTVVHDDENYKNEGRQPILLDGTRVKVVAGDYKGRMAVINRTVFASAKDSAQFHDPHGEERMFADVDYYVLRTRDAQNITITAKPGEVEQLSTTDGWARGEV